MDPDTLPVDALPRGGTAARRPLSLPGGAAEQLTAAGWDRTEALRSALSVALLAAERPHEVLPLPQATHLPVGEAATANLLLHGLDFLRRALGLPRPAAGCPGATAAASRGTCARRWT